MTTANNALLPEWAALLRDSGYEVTYDTFANAQSVLIAESLYALVCCFETSDWDGLQIAVSDVQAELTQLSAKSTSARMWDLYLVAHMLSRPPTKVTETLADQIEADTHYARKFVRVLVPNNDFESLKKALRPLLPLDSANEFNLVEPLEVLKKELFDLNVPHEDVVAALDSFSTNGEVILP
jgi:hypothetical protein